MASYGEVGINVGSVGRWTRFVLGILMLSVVAMDFYSASHTHDMASYLMMVLSFVAILGVYTLGHVLIGDKLREAGSNPARAVLRRAAGPLRHRKDECAGIRPPQRRELHSDGVLR